MFEASRITIFCGHYGSGKTNLALNYAVRLSERGLKTVIADIDIVNPYFRTADSEAILTARGIRLISSRYANTNAEMPSLPPEVNAVFDDRETHAVFDVGGDDRGAFALGRYAEKLRGDYRMLLVINKFRPETRDADSVMVIKNEIEAAAHLKFTGIVNNSNLGEATAAGDILSSADYAREVSAAAILPVVFTGVRAGLESELAGKIENLFPVKIYKKEIWKL